MNLNYLTIKEARAKLDAGEISSEDLTLACLEQIKKLDGEIHACLSVCEEEALVAARAADIRIKKGERGNLLGIPFLAKDNILTKGIRTTAASKILENYIAPFDATIIKKLKKAGAVLLGKTNLDEFAHGASTENSAFGPTHNPWDVSRVPGGSSGGSGAAVASNMCLFALGTDTGGSIRCPASFCGVAGLKPSYGRSSRFGLISMTSSTDVPGPIAKNIEDLALVLHEIAGHDHNDATTVTEPVKEYKLNKKENLASMKIGVPEEALGDGVASGVREAFSVAVEHFKKMGAEILPIKLPHMKYGIPVYYIITPSEISSNLARFDGIRFGLSELDKSKDLLEVYEKTRGLGFGPEAKRRIMVGTYALSSGYYDAYYLKAQKVRTKIKEELDFELNRLDAIITPTQPDIAFKIGEQCDDPIKMYLEDIFLSGPSLAGLPAVSVPCGFSEGMPVGLQIIGRRLNEEGVLDLAYQYEQSTEWHNEKVKI